MEEKRYHVAQNSKTKTFSPFSNSEAKSMGPFLINFNPVGTGIDISKI
jgi:hypothetical protein